MHRDSKGGFFICLKTPSIIGQKDNYAYAYDEKTIHIRIRTKRDDVQSTTLIYGDPYEWTDGKWISSSAPMKKTGSTALFDYWSISIEPKFKRLRYGFELKAETETLIYAERGFFSSIPNDDVGNFFLFSIYSCK